MSAKGLMSLPPQGWNSKPQFLMWVLGTHSGPLACVRSVLPTEPSLSHYHFLLTVRSSVCARGSTSSLLASKVIEVILQLAAEPPVYLTWADLAIQYGRGKDLTRVIYFLGPI